MKHPGHPDHRVVSAVVTEVFQSQAWARPVQLYYPALPTGKVPPSDVLPSATVDERFLSTRISVGPRDYEKAKQAWLCHLTKPIHAGAGRTTSSVPDDRASRRGAFSTIDSGPGQSGFVAADSASLILTRKNADR